MEAFGINHDEFIDLCILCGCDYSTSIPGIGPIKAFKLIEECRNIEAVLKRLAVDNENPNKKKKYVVPENFYYAESRALFKNPSVDSDKDALEA